MYIWRLWGNVWEVGGAGDYFAYKFAVMITYVLILAAISAAWLVLWGTYRLAKLAGQRPLVGAPLLLIWLAFAGYVTYSALNPPRGMAMPAPASGSYARAASTTTVAEAETSAATVLTSARSTAVAAAIAAASSTRAPATTPSAASAAKPLVVANTGGAGVNLRTAPQVGDNIIAAWPDGTPLSPTGRTTKAGGLTWVEVRDPNGHVGWASDAYIAPAQAASVAAPSANDPVAAVRAFYAAINDHNVAAAWNLYSPRYRATWDYNAWVKAYANTRSVTTSALELAAQAGDSATVQLTITAVDDDAGKAVTTVYRGTWQLVRTASGWQLDTANIQQES